MIFFRSLFDLLEEFALPGNNSYMGLNGPHNAAPRFRRNIAFHIKYDGVQRERVAGGRGGIAGCTGSCAVTILYVIVKRLAFSSARPRKRDFNILSFDSLKTRRVQTRDICTYDPIPWIERLKRMGGSWLDVATCQPLVCGLPRRMFQNVDLPLRVPLYFDGKWLDAKEMVKITFSRSFRISSFSWEVFDQQWHSVPCTWAIVDYFFYVISKSLIWRTDRVNCQIRRERSNVKILAN